MKAEELLLKATAEGIDLIACARVGTPKHSPDVASKRRRWGTSRVLLEPPRNRARGACTSTRERPAWTLAELGQAAAGVPDIAFRAACFAFAGEESQFWTLHRALTVEGQHLRRQFSWPERIRDIHGIDVPYLAHLAKLVLDEDRKPSAFSTVPGLHAVYMRVSEKTWDETLSGCFESLRVSWLDWLGIAARIMQPRLRENQELSD